MNPRRSHPPSTPDKQREAADYEITYDFSLVDDDPKSSQGVSALGLMAHLRRGELLNHAVVDRLLTHKWDIVRVGRGESKQRMCPVSLIPFAFATPS